MAYLRFDQRVTEAALIALAESEVETICIVPDISPGQIQKFSTPLLKIYARPVAMEPLLATTDTVFTYGGIGSIAETLLAGVPMVLIPSTVEQYLVSKTVETLGACILLDKARDKNTILEAIKKMLSDSSYHRAAQGFAEKYRSSTPERCAELAVEAILNNS